MKTKNTEVYLALNSYQRFHTIIIKKKIGDYTYLFAVGYAGGGEFGEFYAKLMYNNDCVIVGKYAKIPGSGEWENKLTSLKFNEESEWFDSETEDLYEFMESEDEKIQYELIDELNKYIHYGYDEENDLEYEYPEAKPIDTSFFNEFEGNPGIYHNNDWSDEFLEITNSDIWSLSTRFPYIIESYL